MIYLTNGAELDINGGADVDFTASTTGTYKGVLIYVDRDDSSSHLLNGGSSMLMTGAVYAPSANIDYNGSNDTAASCVQIVASQIALSGNSAFSSACASATGVDALVTAQKVLLVE